MIRFGVKALLEVLGYDDDLGADYSGVRAWIPYNLRKNPDAVTRGLHGGAKHCNG